MFTESEFHKILVAYYDIEDKRIIKKCHKLLQTKYHRFLDIFNTIKDLTKDIEYYVIERKFLNFFYSINIGISEFDSFAITISNAFLCDIKKKRDLDDAFKAFLNK